MAIVSECGVGGRLGCFFLWCFVARLKEGDLRACPLAFMTGQLYAER